MKDMKTKEKDIFQDDTDRMLAQALSPLRETVVPDEGFSARVMGTLPRRDISLWVIMAAILAGAGLAVWIMGWEQATALYHSFIGFFTSLADKKIPSLMSQVSVVAVLAVLGFAFYAFLDTDDYQNVEPIE